YLLTSDASLLNPKGTIAKEQYDLLRFATILSLVVILPVFFLTFFFAYKYRESKNNKYSPNWDTHKILETVWWGIPIIIILILSIVAWNSSHNLDPFKKISSTEQPLKVQVVATQWRWLFIYPEQNIATLNYLKIPTNRPVNFEITSDAPMNSFWIPDLGGQIYAMSGMKSQLSLEASQDGVYKGVSANISGEGFSDMNFNVYSVADSQFNQWVSTVQNSDENLNSETYDQIAEKSTDKSLKEYKLSDNNLFDYVLHKGMGHSSNEMSSPMQPQMEGLSY
ncbi:MAG: ubiquinol oxidase subunit II, partial [Ignavibacteriae bacterium]|nr:ubiquinol oxidase subunit II [Ignavibacteriota bacterium]